MQNHINYTMQFIVYPQRYLKPARRDKFKPESKGAKEEQRHPSPGVCPTHHSASLDTRILTGKVQVFAGAGGAGLGDSAASTCLSLTAAWFSLLTTHQTKAKGKQSQASPLLTGWSSQSMANEGYPQVFKIHTWTYSVPGLRVSQSLIYQTYQSAARLEGGGALPLPTTLQDTGT